MSMLIQCLKHQQLHAAKRLIQSSAPWQLAIADQDGLSALHWAVQLNLSECVEALLNQGANAEQKDHQGRSALDLALEQHRVTIIEQMFSRGIGVKATRVRQVTPPYSKVIAAIEDDEAWEKACEHYLDRDYLTQIKLEELKAFAKKDSSPREASNDNVIDFYQRRQAVSS